MTNRTTTTTTALPTPAELSSHVRDTLQAPVAHLRALRLQITAWRTDAEQVTEPNIVDAARAALEAGTTLPEGTRSQLETQARDYAVASTIIDACGRATVSLPTEQEMRRRTVDDVCQYLHDTMNTLVNYAADFDDEQIITSADEAVTKGGKALEQYKTTRAIVDTYGEIRRLQAQAYTDSGESLISEAAMRSGQYRNALDAEDYWLDRRRALAGRPSELRDAEQRQWVAETPETPWGPIKRGAWPENVKTFPDQIRYVLWALRQAEPWVPTPAQLAQADENNSAALIVRQTTTGVHQHGQRGLRPTFA